MRTLESLPTEEYIYYVGLLDESQKLELEGKEYAEFSLFNPIQDADDNWIISIQEMKFCTNEYLTWVKDLPIIEYKIKDTPIQNYE